MARTTSRSPMTLAPGAAGEQGADRARAGARHRRRHRAAWRRPWRHRAATDRRVRADRRVSRVASAWISRPLRRMRQLSVRRAPRAALAHGLAAEQDRFDGEEARAVGEIDVEARGRAGRLRTGSFPAAASRDARRRATVSLVAHRRVVAERAVDPLAGLGGEHHPRACRGIDRPARRRRRRSGRRRC